jgi:hypothetical protein
VGILTGALLVVCMFVFRPCSQDSTAGSLLWAPAAARQFG